jgi:hypothetical protein
MRQILGHCHVLDHVGRIRERINVYRILVEKSKGTDNLAELGSHRVENGKMGFKEIGWEGAQCIRQPRDRE